MQNTSSFKSLVKFLGTAQYSSAYRPVVPVADHLMTPLRKAVYRYKDMLKRLQQHGSGSLTSQEKLQYLKYFSRQEAGVACFDFKLAVQFIADIAHTDAISAASALFLCLSYHLLRNDRGNPQTQVVCRSRLENLYVRYLDVLHSEAAKGASFILYADWQTFGERSQLAITLFTKLPGSWLCILPSLPHSAERLPKGDKIKLVRA